MSFSSTSRRMPPYLGNGTANAFSVNFLFHSNADLMAIVVDDEGEETELTYQTDFTVTGARNKSGGTLTLVDAGQAWLDVDGNLATDWQLIIFGKTPLTQLLSIRNQGRDFDPARHEDAFDKVHMALQELKEVLDRCIKLPRQMEADDFDVDMPANPEANRMLMVTADGLGLGLGPTPEELSEAASNLAATLQALADAQAAQAAAEAAQAASETAAVAADGSADSAAASELAATAAALDAADAVTDAQTAQAAAEAAQAAAEAAAASIVPVPAGGTTGQVLTKASNLDGDLEWGDAGGGGSVGTAIQESLTGTFGGVDTTYTLSQTPLEPAALLGYLETRFQVQGLHYTLSGQTITVEGEDTSDQKFNCAYRY